MDQMENQENAKSSEEIEKKPKKKKAISKKTTIIIFFPISFAFVILLCILFLVPNKERKIKITVRSTLENFVEKSDLETVNISYNVIAKKCKDEKKCDLKSNNIDDFQYVVSCKGKITAGIDFSKVKIDVEPSSKKIIIHLPDANLTDNPTVGSIKFLNGAEVPSDELPNARALCQDTIIAKSKEDKNVLPAAKNQATLILTEFYGQWIKAYDASYSVEVV